VTVVGLATAYARGSRRRVSIATAALVIALASVACRSGAPTPSQTLRAAVAAQRAGELATAERLYGRVLDLQPRNAIAHYDLGTVRLARDDLAGAEASFRAALDGHPSFVRALFNLAVVRTRVGATQEAIDLYRRVITIAPLSAGAHRNLGLLLQAAGLTRQADEQLALARALTAAGTGT
jgi:Tfp pilus assembly protein PilF